MAEIGGSLDPNSPGWLRAAEQDRVDIAKALAAWDNRMPELDSAKRCCERDG